MKHITIILIISLLGPSYSIGQDNHINGIFMGQHVNTYVDHELAAYYFNHGVDSIFNKNSPGASFAHMASTLQKDKISNHDLKYLSNQVSVDFATLFFAQKTYSIPKNHEAQNLFLDYLNQNEKDQSTLGNTTANEYLYVFVPGLFYKRHPETGGDFAAQRVLLKEMGLSTYLIETNEVGSVRENAKIIAGELKRLSQTHQKIVIISASKGGPDLAYALGKLMPKNELKAIKAWVSVGGVLRGSAVADKYLKGIKRLYAKIVLFFIGAKINLIDDLSQAESISRYNSLKFPDDLLIIHYVGAPLSGQLDAKVKKNFEMLSKMGPNDGLTTLTDELTPQGIVITELGLDHYYRDPHIDKKAIALLYAGLHIIDKNKETTIHTSKKGICEH